jgi:HEAT repeat protein
MPVTIDQVLAYLHADEVEYAEASRLGPDALPYLISVIHQDDTGLAAKAAYLAGLIGTDRSAEAIRAALNHREPAVRVAGASVLARLPGAVAEELLQMAFRDQDVGVRRLAIQAVPRRVSPAFRLLLESLAGSDPDEGLRQKLSQVLQRLEQ